MRFSLWISAVALSPIGAIAAPANYDAHVHKRENLCHLKAPPVLCQPNATVTVEETALRAYQFYRAFVVDGDPKTMFSLIDNVYKVSLAFSSHIYERSNRTCRSKTLLDMRAALKPFGPFSAAEER
jgi:hypothetical protein